jgi:prepilin-type N-terminal cleavage/methylation domain-containing protein
MKKKYAGGFSIVELMVVVAIIGVMGAVASMAWQRYAANANLKTAARDLVSEIQSCKTKAISESRDILIIYSTGPNSGSWIKDYPITTIIRGYRSFSTSYGYGIKISSVSFGGTYSNAPLFQARGTSSAGTLTMTNSRGSTATITTNITGKAYVTFAMQ